METKTYEATYIRRDNQTKTRAIVDVDFDRVPLTVTFPYSALEKAGINEGDKFRYTLGEGYDIDSSSIELVENKLWTNKEKAKFIEFFQKSVRINKQRLESEKESSDRC